MLPLKKRIPLWEFFVKCIQVLILLFSAVYEIVARQEPHVNADQLMIAVQIRDAGLVPEIPQNCDPLLRQVMSMCWHAKPQNRPVCLR